MSFGDTNSSDNIIPAQVGDVNVVQQQHDLAGLKMASESIGPAPLGNMAMVSGLPEVSVVAPGAGVSGDGEPDTGLDKSKSVKQLISAGVFKPVEEASGPARPADAPAEALKTGESPQVTITYSDTNSGAGARTPDFIVKQDGTIEASGDPSAVNKKDVVIQVDRAPGSISAPDATQQKSIDGLVNYLYGRYSSEDPAVAQNGLKLNDQYGLLSHDVAKQVEAKPDTAAASGTTAAARQNFAPQTQGAMSQGNRFTPGSGGQMTRADIDNLVPERNEKMAQNETNPVADIKNAIAGEFKPDAATKANPDAPYQTTRMDGVGNTEVPAIGRYGITEPIIRRFFAFNFDGDDDFDDDNIAGKMDAMAKSGKISKSFAKKFHNKEFAHRFVHAMHEMKAGHMPSQADMKDLMPPAFQEQIAADVVGKFSQSANGDAGKTALAFHLGKDPKDLSATETADAANKEYMRTANVFASASHLRDSMGKNNTADYTVSADGSLLDARVKRAAIEQANSMGGTKSKGECAAGFQLAWAQAGYSELLMKGDGWQMHYALDKDPNFVRVDRETAYEAVRKGHVAAVCRQWASDPNGAGHVETLMADKNGNIIGASDYHGAHRAENDYYNWRNDHFYLPKADVQES